MPPKHVPVANIKTKEIKPKMSPTANLLNAEIYGLGKKFKQLQPPGGSETGIFDAYRRPLEKHTVDKKVKDHLKSHIFEVTSIPSNKTVATSPSITNQRDKYKSTVFDPDVPQKPPLKVKPDNRNPIIGNDDSKIKHRKYEVRNPITSEGIEDSSKPLHYKQPPGGKSGLVLEYNEMPEPF